MCSLNFTQNKPNSSWHLRSHSIFSSFKETIEQMQCCKNLHISNFLIRYVTDTLWSGQWFGSQLKKYIHLLDGQKTFYAGNWVYPNFNSNNFLFTLDGITLDTAQKYIYITCRNAYHICIQFDYGAIITLLYFYMLLSTYML